MPGNEQYPGAKRRFAKKGPTKGSGGKRRRGLEGRGPTPKAEDRVGHPKARAKARAEARAAQPTHAKRLDKARDRFDVPAGHEVVCGRNAVAEAARAGVPITRVFMASSAASSGSDDRLGAVVRRATLLGAPVLEATRLDLEALTDGAAHQGVAIEVPAYEYADARDLLERAREAGRTPLLVALDQVTDPHNLGAVLRNAGAFGADGVIIPERRSVGVNTTVWKVSAGAAARVPVARETNLVRTLTALKKEGCFVVGLDGGGDTALGGHRHRPVRDRPTAPRRSFCSARSVRSPGSGLTRMPVADTMGAGPVIPNHRTDRGAAGPSRLGGRHGAGHRTALEPY